ncbi:hypothetical protein OPT61_g9825 [Boeremia exigua]|uniref:Uncharacterized protein n=1 Tax=Boeremia exigua TaxID=749465 RepID=A0ACC2HSF6_9PLEO|nr:hypothetical protein OPT61_g9825 [Boeremia exigua]
MVNTTTIHQACAASSAAVQIGRLQRQMAGRRKFPHGFLCSSLLVLGRYRPMRRTGYAAAAALRENCATRSPHAELESNLRRGMTSHELGLGCAKDTDSRYAAISNTLQSRQAIASRSSEKTAQTRNSSIYFLSEHPRRNQLLDPENTNGDSLQLSRPSAERSTGIPHPEASCRRPRNETERNQPRCAADHTCPIRPLLTPILLLGVAAPRGGAVSREAGHCGVGTTWPARPGRGSQGGREGEKVLKFKKFAPKEEEGDKSDTEMVIAAQPAGIDVDSEYGNYVEDDDNDADRMSFYASTGGGSIASKITSSSSCPSKTPSASWTSAPARDSGPSTWPTTSPTPRSPPQTSAPSTRPTSRPTSPLKSTTQTPPSPIPRTTST